MLEYGRIDVSERNDVNKNNESRKYVICDYYYFFRIHFRFQPKVYDVCHDIIQNAMSFNDVLIHFRYMSKY